MNDEQDNIALNWIRNIEGPNSQVRERDVYPLLRAWVKSSFKDILEIGPGQART